MFNSLVDRGQCLVAFETDNHLRRLLLFLGTGTSEQSRYTVFDVEEMFLQGWIPDCRNRICDEGAHHALPAMPENTFANFETVGENLALADARPRSWIEVR